MKTSARSSATPLVDSIQDGTCVLVLGPYANLTEDGKPHRTILANYLVQTMLAGAEISEEDCNSFGSVVGRVLLNTDYNKTDILARIKKFFQEKSTRTLPDNPYELVVRLGFKTIFSTDPGSQLMDAFSARNRDPLGVYFKRMPQPQIVEYLEPTDGLEDNTPVIVNLFGLYTDPGSLAITPEEELRQLYALTSQEVNTMINKQIGERLGSCRWYLFVGFNFNWWALASIVYFFNNLTENTKDTRVFGLHSMPSVALKDATVVYYKNLFPSEHKKNDILIDNLDTKTFFTELMALAKPVVAAPPIVRKKAIIVYHPKDNVPDTSNQEVNAFCTAMQLEDKLCGLDIQYSTRINPFDTQLTEVDIQHHILTDDVVLFLLSTNWDDDRFDNYLTLAQQRNCTPTQVQGILLDAYNILDSNQQLKPAFDTGAVRLLNSKKQPFNPAGDPAPISKQLDRFLTEKIKTA